MSTQDLNKPIIAEYNTAINQLNNLSWSSDDDLPSHSSRQEYVRKQDSLYSQSPQTNTYGNTHVAYDVNAQKTPSQVWPQPYKHSGQNHKNNGQNKNNNQNNGQNSNQINNQNNNQNRYPNKKHDSRQNTQPTKNQEVPQMLASANILINSVKTLSLELRAPIIDRIRELVETAVKTATPEQIPECIKIVNEIATLYLPTTPVQPCNMMKCMDCRQKDVYRTEQNARFFESGKVRCTSCITKSKTARSQPRQQQQPVVRTDSSRCETDQHTTPPTSIRADPWENRIRPETQDEIIARLRRENDALRSENQYLTQKVTDTLTYASQSKTNFSTFQHLTKTTRDLTERDLHDEVFNMYRYVLNTYNQSPTINGRAIDHLRTASNNFLNSQ